MFGHLKVSAIEGLTLVVGQPSAPAAVPSTARSKFGESLGTVRDAQDCHPQGAAGAITEREG
jgi:hypothetical protein